ncbi:MAG: ATP-grasp domain-containing protein [Thermoguttaceae bacterium]|nr:ATP-grasp domain-containing protein [Thermoguttaceae bacterium]
MFVVEQPFASDFFFRSLEKLQAPVLRGAAVEEYNVANRNLNLVSDKEFVEYYRKIPEPLYCNSENGLSRVASLLPDAPFVRFAELFKNKTKFRQAVAPLYPNFAFREVDLAELQTLRYEDLPRRFVIKPSVGFLSVGVRFVESATDWERAQAEILRESADGAADFPREVVDLTRYLIEETVDGEEIAVDAYLDAQGTATVLDVLQHPFADATDVRDRVYTTSKKFVRRLLPTLETTLAELGATVANALDTSLDVAFPLHAEFRVAADGSLVPIEVNPGRFAGWHTTELAFYAYGIDVYETLARGSRPDWNRILADAETDDAVSYFAIFETPQTLAATAANADAAFDYDALIREFSTLFELRRIDWRRRPLAAIAFAQTSEPQELERVLKLDAEHFIQR